MPYVVSDIQETQSNVTCKLHVPDYTVANLFRQITMTEIPTIAIDKVCITENTSCHADEFLVHRLGLIPVVYSEITEQDHFELNVHATEGIRNVTVQDLIIHGQLSVSCPDLLICKLLPGQSIRLTAHVAPGSGKIHAKWSPVTISTFKKREDCYFIELESVGMLSGREIIEIGLRMLNESF